MTFGIKMSVKILGFILWGITFAFARQPLFTHIYAADPSGHVWPEDPNTLWLYTSHDVPGTNHHATMFDYHVFSTTDLVNWTDHGRVLSVDDVDWGISHAWAADAAFWKGNYYLVFCMRTRQESVFKIGLAISDRPEGPFHSIGQIRGVSQGMDPSLFIDEDHQPYLLYAHDRTCYIGRLADDLMSVKNLKPVSGLPDLQEGPWMHKYRGKYYLSYPGLPGNQWPEIMYYSISDSIMGNYKPMGIYIPYFENQAGSNHGSILQFRGDWIAFYHAAILSGYGYNRNVMADFLTYDRNGRIKPIVPTDQGIAGGQPARVTLKLEAENGVPAGGRLTGTYAENTAPGFSGRGYATGFNHMEEYVEVLAQTASGLSCTLEVVYAAEGDRKIAVLVNELMVNGDYSAWQDIVLPKTDGFETFHIADVILKAGDNRIRLSSWNGDLKIDCFLLKPVIE